MRLLNNFGFDEDAVSPVVGVILMVAITVILAAVIGTFVLDLGGQVQQNAQAGVTFDENEGVEVQVQLNSVQNADHIFVQADTANVSSGADFTASSFSAAGDVSYNDGPTDGGTDTHEVYLLSGDVGGVGSTVTVETDDSNDGQLSVIGVIDGSENIIQTYQYSGGA